MREAVGSIKCPWCSRDAELHKSEARTKLDPESADGSGKPAYPSKYFVICPPTTGYRGCGTTLANGGEAQLRMLDKGHIFGAGGRKATPPPPPPEPEPKPKPQDSPPPKPADVPPRKSAFNPFGAWK